MSSVKQSTSINLPIRTFVFGVYLVEVDCNHATIVHKDNIEAQPSFYEMQCIKNQAFGGASTVVEVFPANRDLIDGQNQRHLWEVDPEGVPNLATGHLVEVPRHCPDRDTTGHVS